jgi:hypothetical protein
MHLGATVQRSAFTRASPEATYALLADVPASVAHFPDLEALEPTADGFVWRLKKLGAGPVSYQVVYQSRYRFDPAARTVDWDPVPGFGNTQVRGGWRIQPEGAGARFTLETRFDLELPLPSLLRGTAEALLERENSRILVIYLGNLATTLNGGDGRVRR